MSLNPTEEAWRVAIVFGMPARKQFDRETNLTPAFITREFGAVEGIIDSHIYWKNRIGGANLPLAPVEILRGSLAAKLGRKVEYTSSADVVAVSRISQIAEPNHYRTQSISEACIEVLFGGRVLEQTFLHLSRWWRDPEGRVDEFPINIYGFPVYGRSVRVLQRDYGGESEVVIPKGWWWDIKPEPPKLTAEDAVAIAIEHEKQTDPDGLDFSAQHEETVIWPESQPGRVMHLVQITSSSLCPTYVIDGTDGSILETLHTSRF